KIVRFHFEGGFDDLLQKYGKMPLPHYMEREAEEIDETRYQTIYAKKTGALAAPTAGLHFTPELLQQFQERGVDIRTITLHVGLGTFKPVQVDDIRDHQMHSETYHISAETASQINQKWKRQICVGTTTCRALESNSGSEGEGETDIFIYPGYEFQCVQSLLTNFHLPESSLIMLVCAFGGYELIMEAYQKAIERNFRFYSYGDAMLIL
nr:S-adenosylmethionine:tRNA ribosyltransferase-isomerase [Chlamydiota bacterium]